MFENYYDGVEVGTIKNKINYNSMHLTIQKISRTFVMLSFIKMGTSSPRITVWAFLLSKHYPIYEIAESHPRTYVVMTYVSILMNLATGKATPFLMKKNQKLKSGLYDRIQRSNKP